MRYATRPPRSWPATLNREKPKRCIFGPCPAPLQPSSMARDLASMSVCRLPRTRAGPYCELVPKRRRDGVPHRVRFRESMQQRQWLPISLVADENSRLVRVDSCGFETIKHCSNNDAGDYEFLYNAAEEPMKRTWTIIGVADVLQSFKWYQSLLGLPEAAPAHDDFGQIADSDGT